MIRSSDPYRGQLEEKKKVCEVNQLLQDNTNKTATIKRVKGVHMQNNNI